MLARGELSSAYVSYYVLGWYMKSLHVLALQVQNKTDLERTFAKIALITNTEIMNQQKKLNHLNPEEMVLV